MYIFAIVVHHYRLTEPQYWLINTDYAHSHVFFDLRKACHCIINGFGYFMFFCFVLFFVFVFVYCFFFCFPLFPVLVCAGGPKHISMPSNDIVLITLHLGQHLIVNPDHPHFLFEYLKYYEDCIWVISSVDVVAGFNIRILNITNPYTKYNTLLLFGYGRTPHDGLSRIYDASTAKPLNWFALNTSEFWIRFEQINDGPQVELEIESYGNYVKYYFIHIFWINLIVSSLFILMKIYTYTYIVTIVT